MFNFGLFLSYVTVVTFTPGPNNIMSLYNASRNGFKKNVGFTLGVGTGYFIILIICSFFNYFLNALFPTIQPIMSILGALYMLYLAYKIFKSRPPAEEDESMNQIVNFKIGVIMQSVNPKGILSAITVISTFIMPYFTEWYILLAFALFLALLAVLSTTLWAISGSLFTKLMNKHYKVLNLAMSLLLVYTAFSISGLMH